MSKKAIIPIVLVLGVGAYVAWRVMKNGADQNVIRLSGNIHITSFHREYSLIHAAA